MKRPLALLVYLMLLLLPLSAPQRQSQAQTSPLQVAIEPTVGNTDTEFTVAVKNFSWDDMVQAEVTALESSENERIVLNVEGEPVYVGPRRRANVPFTPPAMGFWEIEVRGNWLDGGSVSTGTEVPVATAGSTTGLVQRGDEVQGIVRRSDDLDLGIGIFLYRAQAGERASFVVDWTRPVPYESDNAVYVTLLDRGRNSLASDVDFLPDVTFDEAGTYLLVLVISDALESASYTLTISGALSGDEEGGELGLDSAASGLIASGGDEDIYQFDAALGDVVAIGLRAPWDSSLDGELVLKDLNGVVLADNDDYNGQDAVLRNMLSSNDAGITYVIPATGTYQIVARSRSAAGSGPYRLLLRRTTDVIPALYLGSGDSDRGMVPAGAAQAWKFQGLAEEEVVIDVEAQDEEFDPVVTLYGPDGVEVGSDDDSGGELNPRLESTLAADGLYTVAVSSYDGSGGAYQIRLAGGRTGIGGMAGDAERGEELYLQTTLASVAPGCVTCHSIEATDDPMQPSPVGPSHYGVANRAGTRVDGLSANEYLWQSIVEPDAYIVDGYIEGVMYQNYGDDLTQQQIADLVAFLMTLQ